jgi:hypothetical protein
MGLRCSLLGHDYGDSFVERDREERGNEVVVTERELTECTRCGAEKVTAENTEVRTMQSSREDAGSTAASAESPDATADSASTPGASPTDTEQTGVTADQSSGGTGDTTDSGSAFTSPADAIEQAETGTTEETVTADTDGEDAVILDDDAEDGPGSDQWDEPADPEPELEAEPDPEPTGEDAEFVGEDATGSQDHAAESGATTEQTGASGGAATADQPADRDRGEWPEPEEAEDEGFDATPSADPTESTFEFGAEEGEVVESDTGFTSAGPLDNAERSDADDLDYTLYCPECGFDRYAGGSSLRAGDICPECKKGYLAEDR